MHDLFTAIALFDFLRRQLDDYIPGWTNEVVDCYLEHDFEADAGSGCTMNGETL